ncbi:putative late blight resistance protein homolog R1B-12 [Nicotiana sylvestris]|uniref:Late blight resistance protein homolog R1B-12 n=1 Tax=Nicotiana sylvestris TaxID=4096 RepID=A0A1U7YDX0_NICSY|nr:PREDICTED: putative late blight resistance protein homolog R1B-12 [Nicotiana sylvestris]XP_009797446.1 PREDICTED: putative late blight resistance protein homolog R1B-12 [Nicotiana sylvestris]XP_009797452.1 PREDICTED: putative late blight resistance protein homolog R1B-12 [Nicotiana sylvestris]XP_009797461.1 PREDICTED: putative late blight resistance protein homolog R1B-12 [Nicotiana sylvestris]
MEDIVESCDRTPTPTKSSSQRRYSPIDEELEGLQDVAEQMMHQLTRGTVELDVISIVGMPGQSKTTLVRRLYNNPSIVAHFDVRAWCSFPQTYNVGKLLLEILKQIIAGKRITVGGHSMADMLRKSLMGKRYLIVLDDIWEVEAWDVLRSSFPDDTIRSRIIVTTRYHHLARNLKSHSYPFHLRMLNDDESFKLWQRAAFQGEICPPELFEVGQRVTRGCKGLTDLIIMIAGSIPKKERGDPKLWLKVARELSSHSLDDLLMKMIQSSYDRLEDHLKCCLLYMGLFPNGYEIPVSDLLKWWIAEEFVQNIDTLKLEETSKSCLYDLVDRYLITVTETKSDGEIKYCKVREEVHDFCSRTIRVEKFVQLVVPYNPHQPAVDTDEQRKCMYIHDTMKNEYSSDKAESFGETQGSLEFIAHPKFSIPHRTNLYPLLNDFRLIRVLHLLDMYLESSWVTAFQSLTHLRYLAIFVKELDFKWLSHLLHLQTLRVRSSYTMISPAIWKMAKLRHVDINEFSITWEENERVNIVESSEIVLYNLKTLGMFYMSVAHMTPNFWEKFPNLEELRLHIDEFGDVPDDSVLSRKFDFPSSLKFLSLCDIFLTDEVVLTIARLRHLETLKLSEIYFTGEKLLDLNDNEFPALRVLKLHHVFMMQWICSDASSSFALLETLVIKSCSKLEEIPYSFGDIETLQFIKVISCRKSVLESALQIQEYRREESNFQVQVSYKD